MARIGAEQTKARKSALVEDVAHLRCQLIEGERLADQVNAGVEHAIMNDGIAGIAGREKNLETGAPPHASSAEFCGH